jgi:hypothetical protein
MTWKIKNLKRLGEARVRICENILVVSVPVEFAVLCLGEEVDDVRPITMGILWG